MSSPDPTKLIAIPERLNTLIIGGGGREHAIAQALLKSPRLGRLLTTHPGNPGLGSIAEPIGSPAGKRELYRLSSACEKAGVDLVIIGPEEPLADGFADALRDRGDGRQRLVFGPTAAAARIEWDKGYAKRLMKAASVPTAEGREFRDVESAVAFVESRNEPMVVKATGLAKGKGVVVPSTVGEAAAAVRSMMSERVHGEAGASVLIEERLTGREVSVLALVDGSSLVVLPACRDHKRLGEGDTGPNTGGMGAICPAGDVDGATLARIERDVLVAIVDALRRDGAPFSGVLYAGLMLTPAGPKVLEFNARFGDPECQPLMARLTSDPMELFVRTACGTLDLAEPRWAEGAAVCVVLAAAGYPQKPRAGDVITGVERAAAMPGVTVQHAGTALDNRGRLVTAGGRVLGVTAVGATAAEARGRAYAAADLIEFEGKQVRRDIGVGPVG